MRFELRTENDGYHVVWDLEEDKQAAGTSRYNPHQYRKAKEKTKTLNDRAKKRNSRQMTEEEFLNKVEEWHNLPHGSPGADISLHEYLGMTWEQYKEWLDSD